MIRAAWLVLAGALSLCAQDNSGSIGGSILDAAEAAVPNAKISITNTDRNQVVRTLTTDSTGTYSASFVPVGTYSIRVEAKGFKTEERTGVILNVSDDLLINFKLQVGSTTDTIEVISEAAVVELGTPASASTIEGTQVRELA